MEPSQVQAILERRRKANRERQREYRQKDLHEVESLSRVIATLEQQRASLQHAARGTDDARPSSAAVRSLSWEDVAGALRSDLSLSQSQQAALRNQLVATSTSGRVLHAWVASVMCHEHPQRSLSSGDGGWVSVSLPADVHARRHGANWLTQRLYHNMHSTFQSNRFPPVLRRPTRHGLDDAFFDIHVQLEDDRLQVVVRSQRVVTASLDHVQGLYSAFKADVEGIGVENSTGNWVGRLDDDDDLGHDIVYGRQTLIKDIEQNYLCRAFQATPDRFIVVGQNILHDAKVSPAVADAIGMYEERGWRVVDRIDARTSLVRDCIVVTPMRTPDGVVTLDDYAAFFGVHADADREYLTIPNFRTRLVRFFGYIDRDLREYMTL